MLFHVSDEVAQLFPYLLALVASSVNCCSDPWLIFLLGFHKNVFKRVLVCSVLMLYFTCYKYLLGFCLSSLCKDVCYFDIVYIYIFFSFIIRPFWTLLMKSFLEFPLWHSGLRIWHCHFCHLGHSFSLDLITGPGTSYATSVAKKKKKKKERKRNAFLFQSHKDVSKSFSVLFFFLGMHPQHMEVPRPGVELELQLPASTTATQCRILSPLSEVRD